MTILTDILAAMCAAPTKPIGLLLGNSGWHAFHAAASDLDLTDDNTRAIMGEIRRLSVSRSNSFGGFDLILGIAPNPLGGGQGRRAA